jgi:hypothetical protein
MPRALYVLSYADFDRYYGDYCTEQGLSKCMYCICLGRLLHISCHVMSATDPAASGTRPLADRSAVR